MARRRDDSDRDYKQALEAIQSDSIDSVYVIYGAELFLQTHLLKSLQNKLIDSRSQAMDYHLLDADGKPGALDFPALQDELRTPVFFSSRRMLILRNSRLFTVDGQSQHEQALELIHLAQNLGDVCLVFQEEKIDRRYKKIVSAVESSGRFVEINQQSEESLRQWLSAYLQRYRIRITREASESLILRTQARMDVLMDELKKLKLYCQGSGTQEVDIQIIEGLCAPDLAGDIFRLTDALSENRSDEAWFIFENLKHKREPLPRILVMIARHYKQLIVAHELRDAETIRKQLKCYPFVARKLQGQVRRYTRDRLLRYYEACAETDWAIKSGQMNDQLALDLLIGQLTMM